MPIYIYSLKQRMHLSYGHVAYKQKKTKKVFIDNHKYEKYNLL